MKYEQPVTKGEAQAADPPKALVAGWFSFADGHATAGDLLARDVLCDWLAAMGIAHVVACAPPFAGGPALDAVDPAEFSHAFFVCGPFGRKPLEAEFLARFAHCRLIGLNLSMDLPPQEWQPFDLLIERDSDRAVNSDLVFASRSKRLPVAGVCLVEPHPEADVDRAHAAVERLLARQESARVPIDTRLDSNETGLRSPSEVNALIARMDLVVTSRLHGLVLALKNGVPALAVDAVPGGGKISRQCLHIGWPNVLGLDELDDSRLDRAWQFALSDEARALALECTGRALQDLDRLRARLATDLSPGGQVEAEFAKRRSGEGMRSFLESLRPLEGSRSSSLKRFLSRALSAGRTGERGPTPR